MIDVEQTSLIEALKGHDRAAWAAAVERHNRDVYGFVYHLTGGDRAVAEDLSQEAWLEAVGEVQKRMQEVLAEHGDDQAAGMAAWMQEWTEMTEPTTRQTMQDYLQGVWFYASLKDEHDSNYAGNGVKLGTAERPIFWYQPTGADAYRVIYGDLRVEEVSANEAAQLAEP